MSGTVIELSAMLVDRIIYNPLTYLVKKYLINTNSRQIMNTLLQDLIITYSLQTAVKLLPMSIRVELI